MNSVITPHGLILFITSALSLVVGISAWQRRYHLTGKILAFFMLSISVWSLFSGFETAYTGLAAKVFWSKMSYFGFVFVSPLCFLFILAYTNHWKWIKKPFLLVIGVISIITLVLAWTNEYHGLIWSAIIPGDRRLNIYIYEHGIWFWVFVLVQVSLYIFSLVILIRDLKFQKSPYREQTITILIATLFPAVAGVLYTFELTPLPGLEWTSVFTFVTGFIFTWSIFRYRLLDLVPIARDVLVEQMLDGMVVLDEQLRIIDINPGARNMIKRGGGIKIGDDLSEVMPDIYSTLIGARNQSTTQILTFKESSSTLRYVDVRFTFINGTNAGSNCTLLLLRDITKRKKIEDSLNKANRELEKRLEEIQKLQNQLREESIRDPLTDLYNRRYLEDSLQREFAHAHRDQYPVSIIMADIDHFKNVNDSFGHAAGDRVLQQLAGLFITSFRIEDIVCRYGGEEFIVVMPGTTSETAYLRTENFRTLVEQTPIKYKDQEIMITISAGVGIFPTQGNTVEEVIKVADQALYQAKSQGRNRVIAG